MFRKSMYLAAQLVMGFLLVIGSYQAQAQATTGNALDKDVFAVIDGDQIATEVYMGKLQEAVRKRFYHGKVPDGEMAKFQREIADKLIMKNLLYREAVKRNIQADKAKVEDAQRKLDKRYQGQKGWAEAREKVLANVAEDARAKNLVEKLEAKTRAIADPADEAVRVFYEKNPDKFTEPEQIRLSVILLKVDPSSTRAVWQQTREVADMLYQRLAEDASFADLAKEFSNDLSASSGGDMGYLHRGMLGPEAQEILDELKPGEIGEPIRLLEGVFLFRLDERLVPTLRDFESVKNRAKGLWQAQAAEEAWKSLKDSLLSSAKITINESHFLPLPDSEKEATDN